MGQKHQILWLDVSVNYLSIFMQIDQRSQYVLNELCSSVLIKLLSLPDPFEDLSSFTILHYQMYVSIIFKHPK